jgi:hypothetical protein
MILKKGEVYGNFTIIDDTPMIKHGVIYYKILCSCGNILYKKAYSIFTKETIRCKKCQYDKQKFNTLFKAGEIINNFIIVDSIPIKKGRNYFYKIKCRCGNIFYRSLGEIRHSIKYNERKYCTKCYNNDKSGNKNSNWKGFDYISKTYYNQIKRGARIRHLKFNLTIEEINETYKKQNGKCALTGLEIKMKKNASLDRINSIEGYNINNIQFIHKDINKMKNNFNEEYFISMCKLIADFNNNKQGGKYVN